jgi:glycosyltransferase involved in cell wall biosynthesis
MTVPEATPTLVIIPAFDEEEALPSVLRELTRRPGLDVIVVDDGSTDRTAEVAAAEGVTVLSLPFNLGIGGALRTGFLYAVRNGYHRAVQFDGDGQHLADEIPTLLAALDDGADMVVGSRFAGQASTYTVGRVRARAMGILRFTIRTLTGRQFSDTSSGFRGFNRDVLEFFARTYPSEYMESVEALLLACAAGFRVTEVPVHMTEREAGQPSNRRLRLVYHYLRLLVVLVASAPRRAVVRESRS